jgi:hypothetical protein
MPAEDGKLRCAFSNDGSSPDPTISPEVVAFTF